MQSIEKNSHSDSAKIINRLFIFFEYTCPGFRKQFPENTSDKLNYVKLQWTKAFIDSGINTIESIERGIKYCRIESPICIPRIKDFLSWCKPRAEEFGIPDIDYSYQEAIKNSSPYHLPKSWTHKFIEQVTKNCGLYELSHLPSQKSFELFKYFYEKNLNDLLNGKDIYVSNNVKQLEISDYEEEKRKIITSQIPHIKNYEDAKKEIQKILSPYGYKSHDTTENIN